MRRRFTRIQSLLARVTSSPGEPYPVRDNHSSMVLAADGLA